MKTDVRTETPLGSNLESGLLTGAEDVLAQSDSVESYKQKPLEQSKLEALTESSQEDSVQVCIDDSFASEDENQPYGMIF